MPRSFRWVDIAAAFVLLAARANVLLQALPDLGSAAVHLEWVCHPFRSCDAPSGRYYHARGSADKKSPPK